MKRTWIIVLAVVLAGAAAVGIIIVNSKDKNGWKTYRSSQYGFQLKYPSEWTIYDEPRNGFDLAFASPEMKQNIENEMLDANPEIHLSIVPNNNLSLEQFVDKDSEGRLMSKEETTIDNYPAFKNLVSGMTDETVYYWTKDQKNIYMLTAWTDWEILDQMVATFKFTN